MRKFDFKYNTVEQNIFGRMAAMESNSQHQTQTQINNYRFVLKINNHIHFKFCFSKIIKIKIETKLDKTVIMWIIEYSSFVPKTTFETSHNVDR